ncbi:MAG: DUF2877 domain-containing protein [Anaerolineaceae bacterium]|nr:DUF2877 domain-containing protein [Anaerolineaceae bacterium]
MKQLLRAIRIGSYAKQSLEEEHTGKVMGATSKGVFLLFGQKSLFLTEAQGLSPFNLVVPVGSALQEGFRIRSEAYYSAGDLLIPSRQITVSLGGAEVWEPPQPQSLEYPASRHTEYLTQLIAELTKLSKDKGFLFLAADESSLTNDQKEIQSLTRSFTSAFKAQKNEACLAAAGSLFGLGGGLTPSGDDWLAGFILCRARTPQTEAERAFLQQLGAELTRIAYEKTTFVSANRLEAACKGWSEELFLRVVDFTSESNIESMVELAQALYGFGHSSGVDTLMGIWAASR